MLTIIKLAYLIILKSQNILTTDCFKCKYTNGPILHIWVLFNTYTCTTPRSSDVRSEVGKFRGIHIKVSRISS